MLGSNAVKRRNAKLLRACCLEGEEGVRNWHYHAAVQLPDGYSQEQFSDLLLNTWQGMSEAGSYSHCAPIHDRAGWLDYICKGVKRHADVLCLSTSAIPSAM